MIVFTKICAGEYIVNRTMQDFALLSDYGHGHGWEVEGEFDTLDEANRVLADYRENSTGKHIVVAEKFVKQILRHGGMDSYLCSQLTLLGY